MKNFLLKIILKLSNLSVHENFGVVDKNKVQKWLFMSVKDDGWKNYYTLRKKSLFSLLSLGTGYNKEYWEIVGRLKELNSLSANINVELSRRKKLEKSSLKIVEDK